MKHSRFSLVLCLVIVTVLSSCGATQQPVQTPVDTRAQDEAAVRAVSQEWGKAVNAKDINRTLSFYTDDAWVNPQNAPIAKTADERRSVWTGFFATPGLLQMDGETTRIEVARSGDLAVEYGNFAMTTENKGKINTMAEKYIVAWKKQTDGNWRVIADIWNTDK